MDSQHAEIKIKHSGALGITLNIQDRSLEQPDLKSGTYRRGWLSASGNPVQIRFTSTPKGLRLMIKGIKAENLQGIMGKSIKDVLRSASFVNVQR